MSAEATAASARRFAFDSNPSGTPVREEPVRIRLMLASGPSFRSRWISAQFPANPAPVEVDDAAKVPRGFGGRFVAGPGCSRARGGSMTPQGSLLHLFGGLDFEIAQVLGLAWGHCEVDEQVAVGFEACPGGRAVLQAGD